MTNDKIIDLPVNLTTRFEVLNTETNLVGQVTCLYLSRNEIIGADIKYPNTDAPVLYLATDKHVFIKIEE